MKFEIRYKLLIAEYAPDLAFMLLIIFFVSFRIASHSISLHCFMIVKKEKKNTHSSLLIRYNRCNFNWNNLLKWLFRRNIEIKHTFANQFVCVCETGVKYAVRFLSAIKLSNINCSFKATSLIASESHNVRHSSETEI